MNDIEKAIETLQNYSPCSQENLYQTHQIAISALEQQKNLKRHLKQLKECYHKADIMLIKEVIGIVDDCIVEVENDN